MKPIFPRIRMDVKPAGLKFKPPATAISRYDPAIRSAAKADGEIEVLGEIGESGWSSEFTTAKMVKDQLKAIGKAPVLVTINSPGGDAFEGIAIYNLLREHQGRITCNVIGLAASAGSIIAMAGDEIRMGAAAMMMIHSSHGIVVGNQGDMREFADLLDSIDRAVAGLYAARTGKSESDVLELMKKETWMTGPEAVKAGFADIAAADEKKKPKSAARTPVFASVSPGLLAASGDRQRPAVRLSTSLPGASGSQTNHERQTVKPIAEQIASFEAKRAASAARLEAIMSKASDEGRTLNEAETEEYDTVTAEIETVDAHLIRLKKHEAVVVARATRVVVEDAAAGAAARAGERANSGIITVGPRLEKGIPFTRYVKALAMAKGNLPGALAIAQNNQNWKDTSPEVEKVLMAAVAGGDTTTAGWASELVYNQNLVNEFIEVLRPATVLGRIPGLTKVPFNVRMSGADQGTSANWVGQGKPAPVSKMHTLAVTLGIAKAAGLVVLTQELVRSSQPSAELMVRNDLVKAIAQFLDQQFLSPDYAAVANVSPASMTSGVAPTPATGTTSAALRADVQTLFGVWIAANLDPTGGVWVMPATTALSISLMLNALGQPVFPKITMNGGEFFGLPVVTSQSAVMVGSPVAGEGNMIVLLNAPEILLADDGQVTIDASGEASIEMLDNPTNQAGGAGPTATTMVSMFQTNSIALRATRFINWAKKRALAVQYIKDAAYVT